MFLLCRRYNGIQFTHSLVYRCLTSMAPNILGPLSAKHILIKQTSTPKQVVPNDQLVFGHSFTDHMLSVEWTATRGWDTPRITPYQNLSLDPASYVFHYAFECFEGMKAYRDDQDRIRLFRPHKNMNRLNASAARVSLPQFDGNELVRAIAKFLQLDGRWIPKGRGYSLYIRPTLIGTQKTLGIGPCASALLFVIASPVGPYYPTGFKAVSLYAATNRVRAWPGGFGNAKLGANYAPCVEAQVEATSKGYQQNLWLFGEEDYVTEVGTMNCFTAWITPEGERELVTAPLDGTILAGVTRDSILQLAKQRLPGWQVRERAYTMRELELAANEGRLIEMFGSGTAAVVSPIQKVHYRGRDIQIPLQPGKQAGQLAEQFLQWMNEIQYGDVEHEWSVLLDSLLIR